MTVELNLSDSIEIHRFKSWLAASVIVAASVKDVSA